MSSACFTVVVVVAEGFFVVVVAAGFLVVSAAVADVGLLVAVPALFVGLLVAEPVLFAGLFAVAAEELLSCLFVEGFDVSEEASDELFCLSELSDDELFCSSELVLSEASDEVSEDEPLSKEVSCDAVSAEDTAEATDDELPADKVPLSALQPQADIITAVHKIREMIRFFIFLFLFRLPAVNVIRQGLYSITLRLYYISTQKSRPYFSCCKIRDYHQ